MTNKPEICNLNPELRHVMFQVQVSPLLPVATTGRCLLPDELAAPLCLDPGPLANYVYVSSVPSSHLKEQISFMWAQSSGAFACSLFWGEQKKIMFSFHTVQVSGNISRGHYGTKHLPVWLIIFIPPQILVIIQHHCIPYCIHLNLEFLLNVLTLLEVSVV